MSRRLLVVGGLGKMGAHYRVLVESQGLELIHRERSMQGGTAPRELAAVIVIVPVVSHVLREAAARVAASQRVPIVYLRSASLSALGRALDELGLCDRDLPGVR